MQDSVVPQANVCVTDSPIAIGLMRSSPGNAETAMYESVKKPQPSDPMLSPQLVIAHA
jgi:hypothetical protein